MWAVGCNEQRMRRRVALRALRSVSLTTSPQDTSLRSAGSGFFVGMDTGGDGAGFRLVYSTRVNNVIPIAKYESTRTPLKVVIADVEGPVVNGYFCLATEAHDDDGLPHTLEHLIFLGSHSYPYKGMLDILANRCLASGTNAWTDTDHTCYTMTTAGSQGFLSLLPIYVDHILHPLLTDAGFITEVHHINGDGEDAAVVYCEMQSGENSGESRTHRALVEAAYPGHCGYKSETGGRLANLRESTSNEKVREYHKQFYRPENLVLIITGSVTAAQVFTALQPIEEKILSSPAREKFVRPWQQPVQPIAGSASINVLYPCDDEEKGIVCIGWRGPSAVTQLYDICALMMIMEYLTDTAVSPLQKCFVETDQPLATKVSYSFIENAESLVYLKFHNVPTDKLAQIEPKLIDCLENTASNLDMARMQLVIRRRILEQLSHLEKNPHDAVAFMVIGDMLYGNSNEDLRRRVNQIDDFKALLLESRSYFENVAKRYLLLGSRVTVCATPSRQEMDECSRTEEERVRRQRLDLGEQGLALKERQLAEAVRHNDQSCTHLTSIVPIPSIRSISYHSIERSCNRSLDDSCSPTGSSLPLDSVPIRFQLDHVKTSFVTFYALMDTSVIGRQQRLYLPLLMGCLLESSVLRDGVLVPYESVVAQLAGDTVSAVASVGLDGAETFLCGSHAQLASLMLQVERSKYVDGVRWLKDILYGIELSADRVRVIATKLADDVARMKRSGSKMTLSLLRELLFAEDSNHHACSLMRQHRFLRECIADLEQVDSEPANRLLDQLVELRKALTTPDKITFHMAADVTSLDDTLEPWLRFHAPPPSQQKTSSAAADGLALFVLDHLLMKPVHESSVGGCTGADVVAGAEKADAVDDEDEEEDEESVPESALLPGPPVGCVLSLGCVESSFLTQAIPCISDPQHVDYPAIIVSLQYLSQLEGPFWRRLRAQGLVYGYHLNLNVNHGLLYMSLYRSTHPVHAYKESRRILQEHQSADHWQSELFESAQSSLIFELVDKEKTLADVVVQSLHSHIKKVPSDHNRRLIERVSAVTLDQAVAAFQRYATPLIKPSAAAGCRCSVVCHPSKLSQVVRGLARLGLALDACESLEGCPLSA